MSDPASLPSKPQQLALPFAAVVIPQGGGDFLVRAGKPLHHLSPKQFAHNLGVARSTVYNYIQMGVIKEDEVEYTGPRKMRIKSEALQRLLDESKRQRADHN